VIFHTKENIKANTRSQYTQKAAIKRSKKDKKVPKT